MYQRSLYAATLLLIAFTACNTNTRPGSSPDSLLQVNVQSVAHTDNCYQRITGNANQDTATIHLVINDSLVTGAMVLKIAEKDTRAGILHGSIRQGVIKAVWLFSQEGMSDSIPANFKLDGDKLLQQRYDYNPATGREMVSDTSAFVVEYVPVGCKLPMQ